MGEAVSLTLLVMLAEVFGFRVSKRATYLFKLLCFWAH